MQRGIGYDTGFSYDGVNRRPFDPAVVRRELEIIRDELHCTAVRLFGNELDRLGFAAEYAADLGLEVWFSPFTYQLDEGAMLELLADAARRAERIRRRGAEVVFVTGAELSLFNAGYLPGANLEERVAGLIGRSPEGRRQLMATVPERVNAFLARAVTVVRERFGGRVTYASIPIERVDWTPFDIVSVDAHRSKEVAHIYQQGIHSLVAQGKPVAITEFGCTTHRGAADRGAQSGDIVEYDGAIPIRLKGDYVRDEEEQATYLRELLDVFTAEGVDAAFAWTFVCYGMPHRDDPRLDLDMASWGVVKILDQGLGTTYPGMPWEPKAAFTELAGYYRRLQNLPVPPAAGA
ncbi:MAG TPA: hypothetical protein VIA06_13465 [Candidatus Dormibacteraeota bacterium]|jgi:hypothetical protein|nr:hypothetical protein [Candidatus Dormibacteraeota bacterium]